MHHVLSSSQSLNVAMLHRRQSHFNRLSHRFVVVDQERSESQLIFELYSHYFSRYFSHYPGRSCHSPALTLEAYLLTMWTNLGMTIGAIISCIGIWSEKDSFPESQTVQIMQQLNEISLAEEIIYDRNFECRPKWKKKNNTRRDWIVPLKTSAVF